MAQQNVCGWFKFGCCKFKEHCRKKHVKEKREDSKCKVKNCNLRNPKFCSFFRDYGFCKYGEWCCFKHRKDTGNDAIENLVNENEDVQSKLMLIEENLENLNQKEFETN